VDTDSYCNTRFMVYRPRIPDDTHDRVRKKHFDDNETLRDVYIEAVNAIYNEDGEYTETFKRLDKARENLDFSNNMDKFDVLTIAVRAMFTEDGKPRPGAKRLFERHKRIDD